MIRAFLLLLLAAPMGLADDKPVEFHFEDQFETKQLTKDYRGQVVVLIYGDRKASEECGKLGESLHVAFHPTARGLPPKLARKAATVGVPGLPAGKTAPEVLVQGVACCGKMPSALKPILLKQIVKASPDVPVWLDYQEIMVEHFGLTTGQSNVVVLDAAGRFRFSVSGTPDPKKIDELKQVIQDLRREAAK